MQGNIRKMRTSFGESVQYLLPIGDDLTEMNSLIGKKISLKFLDQINCIHCGKKTKTSFSQGYCYSCFTTLPQTDPSIVHPELDLSYLGISRDMEWAKKNSLTPHYVYLAYSGNLKVGVTRESQVPTRWIDQGASKAIKLAKTPNRHIAGVMEVALKEYFSDKTNWREMLKQDGTTDIDLLEEKRKAENKLHPELKQYLCDEDEIYSINYPVDELPKKITSFGFDKMKEFEGVLKGIKGQYLIFEGGKVINIRKHNGYLIELKVI
ncbi:DUF2797 domain-containing protein [Marinifilum fragile]|uniref:DUF2797 domain-containing protein n=1 Tax=Marinifilum fragile TaxID=570161 RepID=UPI002AABC443|nr:DUF2797 domain-containing protein [Marinifilum fragile]